MEEIAQQFREELQEIIDRYKTRLSAPRITHVAQDVLHKTLSVKHNPELHPKLNIEKMKEMAEKYAKTNRHYTIAKRENGAHYAKEVSSVTIEQAYFAGLKDLNNIYNGNLTRAREIIKDLLKYLPKENIEGVYEVTEAAEEFLRNGDTDYIKPSPGSEPNAFKGPNAICSQGPDGCCATYKGGWDKCKGCGMYHGDNKCID